MAGRNPFPKAAGAGQESCAESTVKMKYSLRGLGGWMGKLGAGIRTGGVRWGFGEQPGAGCRSCPGSDPCGAREIGNKELWPRPGRAQQWLAAR